MTYRDPANSNRQDDARSFALTQRQLVQAMVEYAVNRQLIAPSAPGVAGCWNVTVATRDGLLDCITVTEIPCSDD